MSFIFGGDTGETAESLRRKREVAQAMQARALSGPRNIGEGLTAIGNALAGVALNRRAERGLRRGRQEAWNPVESILGQQLGGGEPATQPAASSTMTQKAPGTPETFDEALPGILAGESGGDYSALYGYANREGGPFADVDVQNMTVGEVMEFTRPDGPYAQWVKSQIGHVATPVGGLQIVGTTLRDAVKNAGIDPSARFSKEVQHQLGRQIFQDQGVDAWVGYQPQGGAEAPAATPASATAPANAVASPAGGREDMVRTLMEASASGFLSPSQQRIVDTLLQRELGGVDPRVEIARQKLGLAREKFEAQKAGLLNSGQTINVNTGDQQNLSPMEQQLRLQAMMRDAYGSPEDGYEWVMDPETGQASQRLLEGTPQQREIETERAQEVDFAQRAISTIDALLEDENLKYATGWGSYIPIDIPDLNAETRSRMNQIQGQAFLRAYQSLRGGGQITEVEGKKAEQAMARLNAAQNEEEYREALREFRSALESILEPEGGPEPTPNGGPAAGRTRQQSSDELDDEALLELYGG